MTRTSNNDRDIFQALAWMRALVDALPLIGHIGLVTGMVLLKHADNQTGICWPAVGTLAKRAVASPRSIRRALVDLENAGLIRKETRVADSGASTSNRYTLIPQQRAVTTDGPHLPCHGEDDMRATGATVSVVRERVTPKHHELPLCELPQEELPQTNRRAREFVRPTLEEVVNYCRERGNAVDPERWFSYYESNGWRVGRNAMKDWRAAVRTWERNDFDAKGNGNGHTGRSGGAGPGQRCRRTDLGM